MKLTWSPEHKWIVEVDLPTGTHQYKYIARSDLPSSKTVRWEEGENRTIQVETSAIKIQLDSKQLSKLATSEDEKTKYLEAENERLRYELQDAAQKIRNLEIERAQLSGEGIGHLKLNELQQLQNHVLSAFMKVNKCIVGVVHGKSTSLIRTGCGEGKLCYLL